MPVFVVPFLYKFSCRFQTTSKQRNDVFCPTAFVLSILFDNLSFQNRKMEFQLISYILLFAKFFCAKACKATIFVQCKYLVLSRFHSRGQFTIILCERKHIFSAKNYFSYETVLYVVHSMRVSRPQFKHNCNSFLLNHYESQLVFVMLVQFSNLSCSVSL